MFRIVSLCKYAASTDSVTPNLMFLFETNRLAQKYDIKLVLVCVVSLCVKHLLTILTIPPNKQCKLYAGNIFLLKSDKNACHENWHRIAPIISKGLAKNDVAIG